VGNFKGIKTAIEGLQVVEPRVFGDDRGFFLESYSKRHFEELGIREEFVQDNHSKSSKGVLRGLHFQVKYPQAKLIRVSSGAIYDVAVDIRKGSPTFGKWFGIELSQSNKKMLFIPSGFAHGFLALEEGTEVLYKSSDYYHPEDESGLIFNDPKINVQWPIDNMTILMSDKDKGWGTLAQYLDK